MNEKVFIFFWFCGGFVVAFVFLVLASLPWSSSAVKRWCAITAFCGLIYEGGCFAAASSFGKATGGGGTDSTADSILGVAFFIAVIWCIVIFYSSAKKKSEGVGGDGEPPEATG